MKVCSDWIGLVAIAPPWFLPEKRNIVVPTRNGNVEHFVLSYVIIDNLGPTQTELLKGIRVAIVDDARAIIFTIPTSGQSDDIPTSPTPNTHAAVNSLSLTTQSRSDNGIQY